MNMATTTEEGPPSKRRRVTVTTVNKWKSEHDKALGTCLWLTYAKSDRDHVASLQCSICKQFNDKIRSCRNYSSAFVVGSKNLRTSAFKDHAASEMHKRAMLLHTKSKSSSVVEYAPIARAFATLDRDAESKLKRKFEIAYLICKEGMAFTKMAPLCALEEKHGVDLGIGYKNNQACATFVDFIAQSMREELVEVLDKAKFFSIQADGSTDVANVEDELFLVQYFDSHSQTGKVCVRNKFLTVRRPNRSNAQGLYDCLVAGLSYVGITDWESKLVGLGCDGTNVNIGDRGLRGYLEETVPCVVVFWCLAHRLELALKDALNGTLFAAIDEMLLRVYYLYKNSPKKCHELEEVIANLRECLESDDLPNEGGSRPLRACGTRFVCHKVAAIGRLVDRFGAYISHITALSEDSTVKAVDRQKLKGYAKKWCDSKMLIGCAMFYDILKPAAILCKVLQDDEVCVVGAIEGFLKTSRQIESLASITFDDLPTVKKVLGRMQNDGIENTYQSVVLARFDESIVFLQSHKNEYVEKVLACLKDRVKVQHSDLLTHILTILATQGWEKSDNTDAALDKLITHFKAPLEKAGVDIFVIKDEWEDMTDYAKRYLDLVQDDYRTIWWKIFNSPSANNWNNILPLIELIFCLPMSNGRLERVFSTLKFLKSDRRSSLSEDRLDHLVRITVEGPPIAQWDATGAVQLWWKSKQRRQVQDTRTAPTSSRTDISEADENYSLNLMEDWDKFIA